MPSPDDIALAEKGLRKLEAMLDKPFSDAKKSTLTRVTSPDLNSWRFSSHRKQPKQTLRRTAYLDGLRGFASLLVFNQHHQGWGHIGNIHEKGFGYDGTYYTICIPGFRLLFSGGSASVAVFFVISGYVLSAKAMSLIHAGEVNKMIDSLASSLFRRWLRLYIPVMCTTFLWLSSWHLFNIKPSQFGFDAPESSYAKEIWRWYCDFKNFSYVFQGEPRNAYNDHSWSIPLEFRGSIVVYTAMLALSRCSRNARLWCEAGLVFYFMYIVDAWYCALFIAGMLLCDLDLLASRNQLPKAFYQLESHQKWIYYLLFIIAIYFAGVPALPEGTEELRKIPGWYYLSYMKPQAFWDIRWFFRCWAAIFLMISVPRIPWLKAFFEIPFNQYLGRISYGFYLVHGPVLYSLGDRIYAAVGRVHPESMKITSKWTNILSISGRGIYGLELNFLVAQLVLLAFTLWLAEIFTRLFDEQSVRLAGWLYKRTTVSNGPPEKGSRLAND